MGAHRVRSFASSALRALPGLMGLLLLSFGAWLAWPPAGFMTAGAVILADVVLSSVREPAGGDEQ